MMNNFEKIIKIVQNNNNFLITSHVNMEGDAIGSEIDLYSILKKLNNNPIILNQSAKFLISVRCFCPCKKKKLVSTVLSSML